MSAGTLKPSPVTTTAVPLEGLEPGHVAVATRAGDRNRLVADFRKSAQARPTG